MQHRPDERRHDDPDHGPASEPAGTAHVARLAPAGRPPTIAVVVTVLLVAAAIVKPWGESGRPSTAPRAAEEPSITPAASTTPTALVDELQEHCLSPGGWRVFSHERTGRGTLRAWKSLEPALDAAGPLDDSLPVVLVAARRIPGLGYCAPEFRDVPPDDADLTIWRVERRGVASRVRAELLLPARRTARGGLWSMGAGEDGGWDEGRYVFALRANGYERWWAIDVVLTGGRRR